MVPDLALILLAGGFAATALFGGLWLHLAPGWRLLAHPNARSFHDHPQVTGGGLAFVLPLAAYALLLGVAGSPEALAIAAATTLVAVVGLWDDVRDVSARLRLLVHTAAALIVVSALVPAAGWLVLGLLTLALVWHVNLYNFMDGIDGLATAQALVFLLGTQVIGHGIPAWPGDLAWLAAGCMLAFMAFNFPPARMFMGDVGSGALGVLTGGMAVLMWQQDTVPLPAALILLSVFWLDATYTLIVRVWTGQAFTQAHRSHLYQKLAARRGHLWTTVCFLGYGLFWLLPLAWLCARQAPQISLTTPLWLAPALLPPLLAAWRFRAGLPASPSDESHD